MKFLDSYRWRFGSRTDARKSESKWRNVKNLSTKRRWRPWALHITNCSKWRQWQQHRRPHTVSSCDQRNHGLHLNSRLWETYFCDVTNTVTLVQFESVRSRGATWDNKTSIWWALMIRNYNVQRVLAETKSNMQKDASFCMKVWKCNVIHP